MGPNDPVSSILIQLLVIYPLDKSLSTEYLVVLIQAISCKLYMKCTTGTKGNFFS